MIVTYYNRLEQLNQLQKHSVLHEVFESDPQVQTEIEEDCEILPDGSIVNRKVTRKVISHVITEKVTRDINSDDEEHLQAMLSLENPTEITETEEELPDGTIIKRKITTTKSQQSTSSRVISEKEIEKGEIIVEPTVELMEANVSTDNGNYYDIWHFHFKCNRYIIAIK